MCEIFPVTRTQSQWPFKIDSYIAVHGGHYEHFYTFININKKSFI